jgi:hypothetical protein
VLKTSLEEIIMLMQTGWGLSRVAKVEFDKKIAGMFDMSVIGFKSWPVIGGKANGVKTEILTAMAFTRRDKFNLTENSFSLAR